VEGEKTADAGRRLLPGWVVLTWPGGAKAVAKADWEPLKGRAVTIWPDADDPGFTAAQKIAGFLPGSRIVTPPAEAQKGWDLADAEAQCWTAENVADHIAKFSACSDTPSLPASEYLPTEGEACVEASSTLPPWVDVAACIANPEPMPEILIDGLLHRGTKMVLGGGSKTNKTWALMDLAWAVSQGEFWLGHKCTKARVLYLNMELLPAFFGLRVREIEAARGGPRTQPGDFVAWNLRGVRADLLRFSVEIRERAKDEPFGLVVVDPIYKALGDRDENKAGDMGKLMDELETLCRETGAAVIFGAHFSKGNQAGKESIDRISGSGATARDADTILTFTRHEQDDAFVVEGTLRNFKSFDPYVARFSFPRFMRDDTLDPAKLKEPKGGRPGREPAGLLELLGDRPIALKEWRREAQDRLGISRQSFDRMRSKLVSRGLIAPDSNGMWSMPKTAQNPVSGGGHHVAHIPLGNGQWAAIPAKDGDNSHEEYSG
ncbi:MAG: AAA family ATPase, partial [Verrucomicrobia bacterium]